MKTTNELEPTRTVDTVRQYQLIFARVARLGIPDADGIVDASAVVDAFLVNEGSWAKRTARLYRAAIQFVIYDSDFDDADELVDRLHRRDQDGDTLTYDLESIRRQRLKLRWKPRTSAKKAKRFSQPDGIRLYGALLAQGGVWSRHAAQWFASSVLTGLRPSEWRGTRMVKTKAGELRLIVPNAKHSNGRAHGTHRRLGLAGFTKIDTHVVYEHLSMSNAHLMAGTWPLFYKQCRKLVYRTSTQLWPSRLKRPTLYTARHMFGADAKSAGHSRAEVAALMGHGDEATAGENYAPRRCGRGSLSVTPDARDVAAVQAKVAAKAQRITTTPAEPAAEPVLPARRHRLPHY